VGALNAKISAMQNKITQLEEALKAKSNWAISIKTCSREC
jgi:hypothetical protein